jgi:hypothetical protein
VKVVAPGTFKDAEIKTNASGHDAREHHVSMALGASGTLNWNVDVVGQGMEFWHDAFLKLVGAQHSRSPVTCLWCSTGNGASIDRRIPKRWSVLVSFQPMIPRAQQALSMTVEILGNLRARYVLT